MGESQIGAPRGCFKAKHTISNRLKTHLRKQAVDMAVPWRVVNGENICSCAKGECAILHSVGREKDGKAVYIGGFFQSMLSLWLAKQLCAGSAVAQNNAICTIIGQNNSFIKRIGKRICLKAVPNGFCIYSVHRNTSI